jgi:hypothetical protein
MSTRDSTRAVAAALLAVALTGCTFGNGPVFLREYRRPGAGEPVPESFWTAAEEDASSREGSEDRSAFEASFWPLPSWLSGRLTSLPPTAERVADTEFQFLDLGVFCVPLLPLWLRAETQLIERTGARAESSLVWTPLWANSASRDWPDDQPRASAWGLPLLYGRIEYGRSNEEPVLELHNVLWTLGPAWAHVELMDEEPHARGWGFFPLMLGGLGGWLWTSLEAESRESDDSVHGPLFGWLGYRSSTDYEDQEFTRRIVAGALWYDSEEIDGDAVMEARHGPLWGLLGWGRSDGEPVIYLFWIPIEL